MKKLRDIQSFTELISNCSVESIRKFDYDLPGNDGEIIAVAFYDSEYKQRIAFDYITVLNLSTTHIPHQHIILGEKLSDIEFDKELLSEIQPQFAEKKKTALRYFELGRNFFYLLES
jgi:hypothetical protein